jgi:FHS family Na+ dependent glucose MFS transporter 1
MAENATGPHSDATAERRRASVQTLGYYAAFIALGLVSASLGPTLPGLAQNTGSPLAHISLLFAARSSGYLAGSLLGGRLYDRTAGHPVMGGSLLVMAAMMGTAPLLT